MPRPTKHLPVSDIKGLRTLIKEGMSSYRIADYYNSSEFFRQAGISTSQSSVHRQVQAIMEELDEA